MTTTRILIVEDELIIAKGIEKRLTSLGYSVVDLASNSDDAIRMAEKHRPDLILMDINLGRGVDGIDTATTIRQSLDIAVVFLTAFSDDATLHRAKLSEPFGFVLKPYGEKELYAAIEIGLYRHKLESRIRENEQWLAATLSSIGDGVIATDNEGRVRLMNELAVRLTGWSHEAAIGKDVREIFKIRHEKTGDIVLNPALEALERGIPTTLADETILTDRSGHDRPIDDSAAPIRNGAGQIAGAVLVFRDITERRQLEEHLRQAQKMEAIGRLAGGIAHDFNNIMSVITGFSELLLTDVQAEEDRREFLNHIHQAGKRAASLTQQIMAFSRKQILVAKVMNLNDIVREMGSILRRLIGADIELTMELEPDLGFIKADATQLTQVILNLSSNARDAMPGGGRLTFRTSNIELNDDDVKSLPDVRPGRYARLSVTDTGSGMSKETLENIFEPFFTTKPVGSGTGLGLASVIGIVRQSGGHLSVVSQMGVGSTFHIELPIVELASRTDLSKADGESAEKLRGSETLLLVDDDESVRKMSALALERSGYRVLPAASADEAMAIASALEGPLHLLLTDFVMPNGSGRDLAVKLGQTHPGLRVLYTSGYHESTLHSQGFEIEEVDFLAKPFGIVELSRMVRQILDRPS